MSNTITLQLNADQIDTILSALGDQPFVKVFELINVIRAQAVPQFQEQENSKKVDDSQKTD